MKRLRSLSDAALFEEIQAGVTRGQAPFAYRCASCGEYDQRFFKPPDLPKQTPVECMSCRSTLVDVVIGVGPHALRMLSTVREGVNRGWWYRARRIRPNEHKDVRKTPARSRLVTAKVPEHVVEAIEAQARATGRQRSSFVAAALRGYLEAPLDDVCLKGTRVPVTFHVSSEELLSIARRAETLGITKSKLVALVLTFFVDRSRCLD